MSFKPAAMRILPLIYFLAVSLPHHPFSYWLEAVFIVPVGYEAVQHIADIASLILLAVAAALGIRIAVIHRRQSIRHLALLFVLILLMYAADYYLIVNNIERIHYPQYAVLALLLGLSLRSEMLIFFVTIFAGFLDEFLQFVMDPMKTNYLDFNDIVLNVLGAVVGIVLVMGLRRPAPAERSPYEKMFGRTFNVAMAASALVVLIAGALGRIVMLVDQQKDRSVLAVVNGKLSFIMSFERHDEFWMKSAFGKVFHVLSPVEGLIATAILCAAMWGATMWLKTGDTKPKPLPD